MINFCPKNKFLSRLLSMALIVSLLMLLTLTLIQCGSHKKTYKIGFMICNSEKETKERFTPIVEYLKKETGYNFTLEAVDTVDFEEKFKKEQYDFTHTNSVLYIILNKEYGINLLVAEKNGIYGAKTLGTIITKKDSPINTVKDLKGKKVIFGPTFAPFGYVTQFELMLRNGIDPYKDLKVLYQPKHSFQHEKIIYGVWFGQYDAGTAPLLDLEEMQKEGKIKLSEDFKIIAKTELYPYCTFGYKKGLPDEVVKKVESALLKIDKDTTVHVNGEKLNIYKASKIEGFEKLKDSDYDSLREVLKKINFPPYQVY